jgi:transporter family-2 protein
VAVLLVLAAIAAGAFLPLQAGINARLAEYVGGPVRASFASFAIGTLVLLAVVLVAYRDGGGRPGHAPWWAWIAGALGAFYVTAAVVVGPRMGAAAFFGILVAAQLVTSVVADRFGWLGFEEKAVSPTQLVGVALLIAGALLVRVF